VIGQADLSPSGGEITDSIGLQRLAYIALYYTIAEQIV
jgi:hypothetical protein